ncbi:hypothetical protein D3C84_447170 [compost metagenome]
MVATSTSMIASSRRKPRFCKASTSKVSKAVRAIPKVSEQPSNKWNARAQPSTSARSVAMIEISANTHWVRAVRLL